jgi:8-oxo-dGTP diphosphatase
MGRLDQGIASSAGRYRAIPRTLCFITHGEDLLLMRGAAGKPVWPILHNGVGGHIEQDEDVYTSALREMHEETGLDVRDVQLRGVINIDASDPRAGILLFVFTAQATSRDFTSSSEGKLRWVPRVEALDMPLVEDLPLILPRVLDMPAGAPPFFAHYTYDERDQLVVTFAGCEGPFAPGVSASNGEEGLHGGT